MKQVEEEEPMPREAEAHGLNEAEAPSVTEATKGEAEAPRIPKAEEIEAEVAKVGALGTTEAGVAGTRAPRTTKARVAEAGALGTTEAGVAEAGVSAAKLVAQEVEMEAGQASVLPPVQGPPLTQESAREVEVHPISSDDTSRGKEAVDAEAVSTTEQPAPTSGEGNSALVWELEDWSLRKSLFLWRERGI
ncbi:uncharacterized protein [Miscanthus floridulus]|uniref:uncharacterized protein n=1 Tax=Miscanthus floridulus TaxID=154761 RepID=UPI003457FC64